MAKKISHALRGSEATLAADAGAVIVLNLVQVLRDVRLNSNIATPEIFPGSCGCSAAALCTKTSQNKT